ncbi:hypothetical protein BT96DRAFT_811713, partial [Gymnopus androsaceus JB14]
DHILCDEDHSEGCLRCESRPPILCCNLCSPDGFDDLTPIAISKPSRTMSRMTIPKYTPMEAHHKLRAALEDWRAGAARVKFGNLMVRQWGSQFLISDTILDRIIDCAGSFKLTNMDILRIETRWVPAHLAEFGQKILDLVAEHFPPPPTPPTTSKATGSGNKCRACGETGHNSMCFSSSSI